MKRGEKYGDPTLDAIVERYWARIDATIAADPIPTQEQMERWWVDSVAARAEGRPVPPVPSGKPSGEESQNE